jgi:hypothetical protein
MGVNMENDIYINNWEELQNELFRDTWDSNLLRYRSPYVYRGLSDKNYSLLTSLIRLGGDYQILEKHLLRNFKKYSGVNALIDSTFWNWVSLAQHYGLPTRLLDWTYSPYIALHFATSNLTRFATDGVIWCLNYTTTKELLPNTLLNALKTEGANVFTTDLLGSVLKNLDELDNHAKEDFIMFLEPPSLDERIIQQHALFSMMNSNTGLVEDWMENHKDLYFRIIIPKELKWEIRDKLDQANITERVLFPGLNGLSLWLKRHYSPKNNFPNILDNTE